MAQKEEYSYSQILEAQLASALFILLLYFLTKYQPLLILVFVLMACGLLSKKAAVLIGRSWLTVSHGIGAVNNRIVLTIIFYVVLTPLAFIYRTLHPELLQLRKKNNAESYFIESENIVTPKKFEKLW